MANHPSIDTFGDLITMPSPPLTPAPPTAGSRQLENVTDCQLIRWRVCEQWEAADREPTKRGRRAKHETRLWESFKRLVACGGGDDCTSLTPRRPAGYSSPTAQRGIASTTPASSSLRLLEQFFSLHQIRSLPAELTASRNCNVLSKTPTLTDRMDRPRTVNELKQAAFERQLVKCQQS